MRNRRENGFGGSFARSVYPFLLYFLLLFFVFTSFVSADLGPENVLLLVNQDSATSQYIAKMYRQYYPAIQDNQVLQLSGLPDCSGPNSTAADEIITRTQYDTLIAEPVRQHLLGNNPLGENLIGQIMVIVTTAGMPYRIEDTNHASVVDPAASSPTTVESNLVAIDAASVESELTCLWYVDQFGSNNRMVNPYQGYVRSPIDVFERLAPGSKSFNWWIAIRLDGVAPKMEGYNNMDYFPPIDIYGTINRQFGPGDIYLTCRLDGPKNQGKSAVFAVREMLERSKRASDTGRGVNPQQAVIVLDDAINPIFGDDNNRVYNLDGSTNYIEYGAGGSQPPDAITLLMKDDFVDCYTLLSNSSYTEGQSNVGFMDTGHYLCVLLDRQAQSRTSQSDLQTLLNDPNYTFTDCLRAVALTGYGVNGDEIHDKEYLLNGGPGGQPLFDLVNGSVFTSIESFNALTMFSDAVTSQAKVIDFIQIGGTGAIGHAFEPVSDAVVDSYYFFYNCFSDENSDGQADLTFVEAAFTGIPYLSWAEVVIGDPLMRIAYGPGDDQAWTPTMGDVNQDGVLNIRDYVYLRNLNLSAGNPSLYDSVPEKREKYEDLCDLNQDGYNNIRDIVILRNLLYSH